MITRRAAKYAADAGPPPVGPPTPTHWWKMNQGAAVRQVPDDGTDGSIPGDLIDGNGSVILVPNQSLSNGWLGGADFDPASSSTDWHPIMECVTNPSLDGVTKLSISVRVRASTSGPLFSDRRVFSQANNTGEDDHVFMIGQTSSGGDVWRSRIRRSGNTDTYVSSVAIPSNADQFVAFVLDFAQSAGNELLLYEDGVLADSFSVTGSAIDGSLGGLDTFVGAQPRSTFRGGPWNGFIADVRLWLGTALTAAEVLEVYNDV